MFMLRASLATLILFVGLAVFVPNNASALPKLSSVKIAAAAPQDIADKCAQTFFGLDPWYEYMNKELDTDPANLCNVKCFNLFPQRVANDCGQTRSDVPGIAAVIIDDLLRVAAIVAIAFILVGSFQYVGSRGNPEQTASARSSILNAVGGLAVALVAIGFVKFLASKL